MPDAKLLEYSGQRITSTTGAPVAGAKLKTYYETTLNQLLTYTTDALTTPHAWPLEADGNGLVPDAYIGTDDYKVIVTDGSDATLFTRDNRPGALDTSAFDTVSAAPETLVTGKSANFSIALADRGTLFNCNCTSGSFTATLPSAVTVGNGFRVGVRHVGTANTVPLVPVLSQTISQSGKAVAAKALTGYGEGFWLVSDGANWHVDTYTPPLMTAPLPFFRVTDRLTAPPVSPTAGARYIVNGTATGVWLTAGYVVHDVVEADGNGGWIKYTPTEGMLAYVEDENLYTAFVGTAWADQTGMATPNTSLLKRMTVQHLLSATTDGGSVAHGTLSTSLLNTTVVNTITGASLASNQITLPAGTYDISAWKALSGGQANEVFSAKCRLYNVTAAAAITGAIGTPVTGSANGSSVALAGAASIIRTVVTFAVETVIRLEHYGTSSSSGAIGLGEGIGSFSEVFAQVDILDLASLQGPQGTQGPQGDDGLDAAYAYQFSTATSGDPGTGKWRLNNADPSLATELAISETDVVSGALAAVIATWDDSTSANKSVFRAAKQAAEGTYFEAYITAAQTDAGTYRTFPITYISHNGSLANADPTAVTVSFTGDKGDTGLAGVTGSAAFTFSTTTADADPGAGALRLNHATIGSVTAAYVDNLNSGGSTISPWLDTFDDGGDSGWRGDLHIYSEASALTVFAIFKVTGSVVDGTGYRKLTLSYSAGPGGFTNGGAIIVAFIPRGAPGTGDVTAAAAFATDNVVIRSDGTAKGVQHTGIAVSDADRMLFQQATDLGTSLVVERNAAPAAYTFGAGNNYLSRFSNSNLAANTVYNAIYPSVEHYDTLQSALYVSNGSTIEHAAAISAYIASDDDATAGSGTNVVGLFSTGIATRSGGILWGLNTLLQDAPARVIDTLTSVQLIGGEYDFNIMCPDTEIIGVSVGGNSLSQPSSAIGFNVAPLGTGIEWTTSYYSQDGAAQYGLALGALATSGTNIDSQLLIFQYFNGAAAKKVLTIQAETDRLNISNDDGDLTLAVVGHVNVPTGKSYAVNGTAVLTGTQLSLGSGGVINFNVGDVTITHSANNIAVAGGTLTSTAFIPSASTVPTDGLYLPAANTLGWAINSAAEMQLTATALSPAVSGGIALGTSALLWNGINLSPATAINFNNALSITHSAAALTINPINYLIAQWAADTADCTNMLFRKARGTGTTIVQAADAVGKFIGQGYDGAAYQSAAQITFEVDGTPGAGDMPGRIVFYTTPDGSATLGEAVRITSARNLKVSGNAARGTTEGTNQVVLFDGTAPAGTLANGVSIYSASGELRSMDAAGNSTLLSPHDRETNEWIYHSIDTSKGSGLVIEMERLLRAINEHLGLDYVHDFDWAGMSDQSSKAWRRTRHDRRK